MIQPPLLDASALIAVVDGEAGWEAVPTPEGCLTTAVNAAEVVSHLVQKGGVASDVVLMVQLLCPIVDVTAATALEAGVLFAGTRSLRLSLADCVCLAHARRHDHAVVTSDRRWSDLDVGVEVIQFR